MVSQATEIKSDMQVRIRIDGDLVVIRGDRDDGIYVEIPLTLKQATLMSLYLAECARLLEGEPC